ncbi:phosphorylated adapter RNA export protein [Hyalella azteca]|uniref:Phosphorylated adapter RNA export protein n=1 Tax=Hyalella azteca TaxID=294128 RepID=A0A8B7N8B1_HYAAZ|nr:phosphorylated adapter RNA export protein [Hyalella azteca]XP_047739244.1 phosphorylated adapter RNA export protein [Hyalella azteca]
MNDREEGELSGSDVDLERMVDASNILPPATAPLHQYRTPRAAQHVPGLSSDEDSSDNDLDDEDCHLSGPKRMKVSNALSRLEEPAQFTKEQQAMLQQGLIQQPAPPEPMKEDATLIVKKPRKCNNIWANVLGEQSLTEEIGVIGLKKLEGDRNVENYDFRAAQQLRKAEAASLQAPEDDEEEEGELHDDLEDGEMKEEFVEEAPKLTARLSRKRPMSHRVYQPPPVPVPTAAPGEPLLLPAIDASQHPTDKSLALVIASALQENKPQIIVNVVEQFGREFAMQLYNDTREQERQGGLMIVTGDRRRTSGGVFLQLLKKSNPSKDKLAVIFPPDEAHQQWRRRRRAVHRRRNRERHDTDRPTSSCGSSDSSSRVVVPRSPRLPCDDSNDALELGGAKCPATSPAVSPGPTPTTTPVVTPHDSDSEEDRGKDKLVDTALAIVKSLSPALLSHSEEGFCDAAAAPDEMDVY